MVPPDKVQEFQKTSKSRINKCIEMLTRQSNNMIAAWLFFICLGGHGGGPRPASRESSPSGASGGAGRCMYACINVGAIVRRYVHVYGYIYM